MKSDKLWLGWYQVGTDIASNSPQSAACHACRLPTTVTTSLARPTRVDCQQMASKTGSWGLEGGGGLDCWLQLWACVFVISSGVVL
jgi:hypothetical protein